MQASKVLSLHQVDKEDLWVSGFIFKVPEDYTKTYEDSFDYIKHLLISPEFEKLLIKEFHLLDGYFDGDETYKLVGANWYGAATFIFINDEDEEVQLMLSADYVTLIEE